MKDNGLNEIPTSNNLFSIYLDQIKALKEVDDFILSNHIDRHLAKRVNNTSRMTSKIIKHIYNDLSGIGSNVIDTALVKIAAENINVIVGTTKILMQKLISIMKVSSNIKLSDMLTLAPKVWRVKKFINISIELIKYVGKIDPTRLNIGLNNIEILSGAIEHILNIIKPINKVTRKSLGFLVWKARIIKRTIRKMVNIIESTGGIKSLRFTLGLVNLSLTSTAIRLALEPIHFLKRIKYIDLLKTGIKIKFISKLFFGWFGNWDNKVNINEQDIGGTSKKIKYRGIFGLVYRASQMGKADGNFFKWDFSKAFINITLATGFMKLVFVILNMVDSFKIMKIRKMGKKLTRLRALLFGGSYHHWFKKHTTIGIFTLIGEVANNTLGIGISREDGKIKLDDKSITGATTKMMLAFVFVSAANLTIKALAMISGSNIKTARGNVGDLFTIFFGGSYTKKSLFFGKINIRGKISEDRSLFAMMKRVAAYTSIGKAAGNMGYALLFAMSATALIKILGAFPLTFVWKVKIAYRRISKILFGTKENPTGKTKTELSENEGMLPLMDFIGQKYNPKHIGFAVINISLMTVAMVATTYLMRSILKVGVKKKSISIYERVNTNIHNILIGTDKNKTVDKNNGLLPIIKSIGAVEIKTMMKAATNLLIIDSAIISIRPIMKTLSSVTSKGDGALSSVKILTDILNNVVDLFKGLVGIGKSGKKLKEDTEEIINKGSELLLMMTKTIVEASDNVIIVSKLNKKLKTAGKKGLDNLKICISNIETMILDNFTDSAKNELIRDGANTLTVMTIGLRRAAIQLAKLGGPIMSALIKSTKKTSTDISNIIEKFTETFKSLGETSEEIKEGRNALLGITGSLWVAIPTIALLLPFSILAAASGWFIKWSLIPIISMFKSLAESDDDVKLGIKNFKDMSEALLIFGSSMLIIGIGLLTWNWRSLLIFLSFTTFITLVVIGLSVLGEKGKIGVAILEGIAVALIIFSGALLITAISLDILSKIRIEKGSIVNILSEAIDAFKLLLKNFLVVNPATLMLVMMSMTTINYFLMSISGMALILKDIADLRMPTYNSNGKKTGTRAMNYKDFEKSIRVITSLVSIFTALFEDNGYNSITLPDGKTEIIVEGLSLSGLENATRRNKKKFRMLNKIVGFIGKMAETIQEIAALSIPMYDPETGNRMGSRLMKTSDFKNAALNGAVITKLFIALLDDRTTELTTSGGVITISGISEEGLNNITNKSKKKFRKLNKIVGFVGKMTETIQDIASLNIPVYDPETGREKGKRIMSSQDFRDAILNSEAIIQFYVALFDDKITTLHTTFGDIVVNGISEERINNITGATKRKMNKLNKITGYVSSMVESVQQAADFKVPRYVNGKQDGFVGIGDQEFAAATGNISSILGFYVSLFDETSTNCIINNAFLNTMTNKVSNKMDLLNKAISPVQQMINSVILAADMRVQKYDPNTGKLLEGQYVVIDDTMRAKAVEVIGGLINSYVSMLTNVKPIDLVDVPSKLSAIQDTIKISAGIATVFKDCVDVGSRKIQSVFKIFKGFETFAGRNMYNEQGYKNLKTACKSVEGFLTKIDNTKVKKITAVSKLVKNLADFSASISGDFNKLADVINDKLVDVLVELKETLEELEGASKAAVKRQTKETKNTVSLLTPKNNTTTGIQTPKTDVVKESVNELNLTGLEDRLEEIIKLMKEANDQI